MDYIFTGPTLNKGEIKKKLPKAIIKIPIKSSDIMNLLKNTSEEYYPKRILIIDGFFHGVLSIRHKEILYAMDQGIKVYGCSSMGALRAAECSPFGMIGVGKIFKFFNKKFVSSDDEVSVSYSSDAPYEELSLPLINIRFTLEDISKRQLITKYEKEKIINLIKQIHFSDRTFNYLSEIPYVSKFISLIKNYYINWKKKDAIEAIGLMKSKNENNQKVKSWKFNNGSFKINYYSDTYLNYKNEGQEERLISGSSLIEELNFSEKNERLLYNSFNRMISLKYAAYLGIIPSKKDINEFQKYIKKEGEIFISKEISYVAKSTDPKVKYKFAEEELTLLMLHISLKNSLGEVGFTLPLQDYLTSSSLFESFLKNSKKSNIDLDYFSAIENLNSQKFTNINLQGRIMH